MSNNKYKNKHQASFEDKASRHIKHDFKAHVDENINVQEYLRMDIEEIKSSDVVGNNSFEEFVTGLKFQADSITSIKSNVRYVKFIEGNVRVFNNEHDVIVDMPAIDFIKLCYAVESSPIETFACVGNNIKSVQELKKFVSSDDFGDLWWVTSDEFVVIMNRDNEKSVSILYDDLVCGILTYESELLQYATQLGDADARCVRDYVI